MNIQTGVFTTAQPGIYQISFTAKYVASRQGTYGAWSDVYVNTKVQNLGLTIIYLTFKNYLNSGNMI